ncbi:hypothetical protein EIP86_007597 [Pleurotus ostreatoroseus]|nr:hypothetical protein EIP86_007597 [Pleurotus ostreatoroseus]
MRSAAHSCFAVQEILLQIVEACAQESETKINPFLYRIYPTLASLARTCTITRDPALDRLWRTQYGLQNLIKCLPAVYWRQRVEDMQLTVASDVDLDDWSRFDIYASRIQELNIDQFGPCDQFELFTPLMRRGYSKTLFPNLKTLKWWSTPRRPLPHVQLVLSPTIRTLIASFSGSPSSASGLTYLPQYCPHIESLRLYLSDEISIVKAEKVLRSLQEIRSLDFTIHDDITESSPACLNGLLNRVSVLPQLETFCVASLPQRVSLIAMPEANTRRFPALKQLTVDSRASCSNFLRTFELENLEHLDITFSPFIVPPDNNTQLMQTVEQVISHSSLKVLHLTYRYSVQVTLESISPAFAFRSLEEFCLYSGPVGVALDDTAIEQLAKAWPDLTELRLLGSIPLTSQSTATPVLPTLQALTYLAQYCPKLETLSIELDAKDPAPIQKRIREGRKFCNTHMKQLSVRRSLIGDTAKVAAFLSELFPNLVDMSGARDGWTEVASSLKAIQTVRSWSL